MKHCRCIALSYIVTSVSDLADVNAPVQRCASQLMNNLYCVNNLLWCTDFVGKHFRFVVAKTWCCSNLRALVLGQVQVQHRTAVVRLIAAHADQRVGLGVQRFFETDDDALQRCSRLVRAVADVG